MNEATVINADLSLQGMWNQRPSEQLSAWIVNAIDRGDLAVTRDHANSMRWQVKTADGVVLASVGDRIENHDGILLVKGAKQ